MFKTEGLKAFSDKFLKKALAPSTHADQSSLVSMVEQMITSTPIIGMQGTLIALATRTDTDLHPLPKPKCQH